MIYHHKVCQQIDRLQEAFDERDLDAAQKIMLSEHNERTRKNMENMFPYGADLYTYFMGYEHTV